ncbi:MAG: GNAT family N-acetyltransferase [Rhodobacteraceae bacterium]|nr:GNAT family N-acetyltransferase [Paracoccaceae bacterium]
MDAFEVRPVKYADVAALRPMIVALADHHGDTARLTSGDILDLCFGTAPVLHVFVAAAGGQLLGYAACTLQAQLQRGCRWCDLHHLYVDAAHRGRGVGHALIQASAEFAASRSCVSLAVGTAQENVAAQRFYLGHGFTQRPSGGPRFRMDLQTGLAGADANATVRAT